MSNLSSQERKIRNEVVFRQHNQNVQKGFEKIRRIAREDNQISLAPQTDIQLQYYCECSDENCRQRVGMRLSHYNNIHKRKDYFMVLPGHEVVQIERIIQRRPSYFVVQKFATPPDTVAGLEITDTHNV